MASELSQQLKQFSIEPSYLTAPGPGSDPTTSCSASFTDGSVVGSSFATGSSPLGSDDEAPAPCCEIRNTPDRGQALFSTRRIRPGTMIFAEEPLVALSKELEESYEAVEAAFATLSKREKKAYLSLFDAKKSRMSAVVSIYYSNCYSTESFVGDANSERPKAFKDCEGGSCIGALASRINHSCIPNVSFSFLPPSETHSKGQMRFYAIKAVSKGKELLSNYDKSIFEISGKRQQKYQLHYGFTCLCEACAPPSDFWSRSNERRRAMKEIVGEVKSFEKQWQKLVQGGDEEHGNERVPQAAIEALLRLENLLVKEGLTATSLANVYRSLVKWSQRTEEDPRQWMEKELDVCTAVFGRKGVRAAALRMRLEARPGTL